MAEDLQEERSTEVEFDFKHYWEILRKNRWMIAACVAGASVLAIVATVMMTPLYRATVTMSVEPKSTQLTEIGSGIFKADGQFLPTQIELLRSRQMAERVVEKLELVSNAEPPPPESGFLSWLFDDEAEIPTRETLVARQARGIQGAVTVQPRGSTNMVEITAVAGDAERAAAIANALAEAYIDWNLEAKFAQLGQASRFLGTEVEQLKGEIAQKERELQEYGLAQDLVSTPSGSSMSMQNLEQINRDYTAAVADRVTKEARYQELRNTAPDAIADTVSGGLVTQLKNEQAKLEREYSEKLNLFKPEWPPMQELKAKIERGRQHMQKVIAENAEEAREQARSEYMTALRRERAFADVLEGRKTEVRAQSSSAVEFVNLQTEIATKRQLLDTLLDRQAETEVTSRATEDSASSVRIVDRALPPNKRFRPSLTGNLRSGVLAGLMLGIGIAFLRDHLDRSLRNTEQVEQYLRLPAIGAIPSLQQAQGALYAYSNKKRRVARDPVPEDIELLPHRKSHSTAAEAYRAVRTSLLLSRAGGLKSIVVSSALPGEGKTATSSNLAIVMAQLGRKTLLIDADLHKPRLHKVFKVSNRHGIVSILAENDDPAAFVHQTEVPHLDVITSGPTSPNPSALLSSPMMGELMTWAHANYDYVLVDTPPLSPITDAVILGTMTDGVVICVHAGKTPREAVAAARDKLQRSNVRVLGVVLNNLRLSDEEYYYYASYYGEEKEKSVARAG